MASIPATSPSEAMKQLMHQWTPEMRATFFESENKVLHQRISELDERLAAQEVEVKSLKASVRRCIFPFEQLPPELRNQIYQYLLVLEKPIRITYSRSKSNIRPDGVYGTVESYKKWYPAFPKKDTALLRVSSQVNKETLSILYDINRYIFVTSEAIREMVKKPGGKEIRHVIHARSDPLNGPLTVSSLKHCTDLRVFEWAIYNISLTLFTDSDIEKLVDPIYKSIRQFCMLEADRTKRRSQYNKIRFSVGKRLDGAFRHWHYSKKAQPDQDKEDDLRMVVAEIEQRLVSQGVMEPAGGAIKKTSNVKQHSRPKRTSR